ncbi:DUF115 domain-containing protein [Bacillus tianshenii]|nr:DUF115 domain-containing protein [Bacillus tianshenii]
MLIENKDFLRKHYRHIRNLLNQFEEQENKQTVELIDTKIGEPTAMVYSDSRPQYVHSKYDPIKEAERLVEQYSDQIDNYEHVIFYGVGFGYHIEAFMNRYPKYTYTIYEPSIEMFYHFMSTRSLKILHLNRLNDIFIESSPEEGSFYLRKLTDQIQQRILMIPLPSYERIFAKQYEHFLQNFKEGIKSKRSNFITDLSFSTRWTFNSLANLPYTFTTPNILKGYKSIFQNKPLIIAAAGPSLEDEYENLRYIKENKLAYIFAIGSANRALVAKGILPDAVCTYDPQQHNYGVYQKMMEQGIDKSVPMIYGTSVGFETLTRYQGPKLHMITSQDTVSQYYLKDKENTAIPIVQDAPTIAAVTYQLACQLGCNPVILVGQNLGFRYNQYYSKEVGYNTKDRTVNVMEKDKKEVMKVKDVYGNEIETNPSFENMRQNLQIYIANNSQVKTINTTKGGAAIEGAQFAPLEELIESSLHEKVVVDEWYKKSNPSYDLGFTVNKITKIEKNLQLFRKQYKELKKLFEEMKKNITPSKKVNNSKLIERFDKQIKKFTANDYYNVYVLPINRTHYQALSIKASNIRKQINEFEKIKLILDAFEPFIEKCKQIGEQVAWSVFSVHDEINSSLQEEENKYYPCDSGVFQFEGEWKRYNFGPGVDVERYYLQFGTSEPESIIRFKLRGTSLRIYGMKFRSSTQNIEVTVDSKRYKVSTKDVKVDSEVVNKSQVIFEIGRLDDGIHNIEIKVLDDNRFMFSGVQISKDSRIYHINEVEELKELSKGKRIRCHYESTLNTVGFFKGIGMETTSFIPSNSSPLPSGDFYFVMVEEGKCIADRNLQKDISWEKLHGKGLTNIKGVPLSNLKEKLNIRLLTGGNNINTKENEWNDYIKDPTIPYDNSIFWNLTEDQLVWCIENNEDKKTAVARGRYTLKGKSYGSNLHSFHEIPISNMGKSYFRPVCLF